MPITGNIAWDERLELYKGRDSTRYVRTAASAATACCSCRLPLTAGDPLSMAVEVSVAPGPYGTDYRAFACCVGHRSCCVPRIKVREGGNLPEELTSAGAIMVVHYNEGTRNLALPALVFTLLPNLTFGVPGAEFTSLLVSILLGQGFQLAPRADMSSILEQAESVHPETFCTVTREGLLVLHVAGDALHSRQLDPAETDGAAWLEAAAAGCVLVLGGDNLAITPEGVNLAPAVEQGTLVTGLVPVKVHSGTDPS